MGGGVVSISFSDSVASEAVVRGVGAVRCGPAGRRIQVRWRAVGHNTGAQATHQRLRNGLSRMGTKQGVAHGARGGEAAENWCETRVDVKTLPYASAI